MANSTDTYWAVDGVSLQTLAWNIETLGGSRGGVPPFRGSNRVLAYRRGAQWRQKVEDSRVISLGMWVIAADADGLPPADGDLRKQFTTNLRALQALFYRDRAQQVVLTKRWVHTDGTIKSADALAEISGMMEPQMSGPFRAQVVVDLLLADPFFYGPNNTVLFSGDGTQTITNNGDAEINGFGLFVGFAGGSTNPTMINSSFSPQIKLEYNATTPTYVNIDCDNVTATSTDVNVIQHIIRFGSRRLFALRKGANTVTYSGGSTAAISYREPYF